jgi:16S rRNA (cytosine967-C5)-methyltransferase
MDDMARRRRRPSRASGLAAAKHQRAPPQGLPARALAVRLVAGVLTGKQPLEQVLAASLNRCEEAGLEARDRALARLVAATVLRRLGELEYVLKSFIARPLPSDKGDLWPILLTAAAQLIALDMPPHAVVDLAVELTRRDRGAHRFAKLANAILRRVGEVGKLLLANQEGTRLNIPDWLWQRWSAAYGEETAAKISSASLREAPLDITVKSPAQALSWAERLGGRLLPTGSIRLAAHGRIEDLPGYANGEWWVQDAAAALVARAAGNVAGQTIADLCAAPGGKTAGLAAAGAHVTAVDCRGARLARLRENLARLHLSAEIVDADAASWAPGRAFDAVILDAPCTATGTIRRHPDILRLKQPEDAARMVIIQNAMLANAATLVRPGGLLIYSTCSLEPEEGEQRTASFLASQPAFERAPMAAGEITADPAWINTAGEVRTLPFLLPMEPAALSGIDGFFVARLRRRR